MSNRQVADDPARQIPRIWTGPSWRWAWDWTFSEWAIASITLIITLPMMVLVVPSGLVAGVALFYGARIANRTLGRRYFWVALLAGLVLLGSISLNPLTWVLPVWAPLAIGMSLLVPMFVVRLVGRYIDWNRPVGYWLHTFGQVASGPRQKAVEEIDLKDFIFRVDPKDPASRARGVNPEPVAPKVKRPRRVYRIDGGLVLFNTTILWRQ